MFLSSIQVLKLYHQYSYTSVIHILKAMGLRNTLVIQHLCHGLKYRLQEFFLRSGLKLDLDLTPSRKQITVSDRDCNSEGGELI